MTGIKMLRLPATAEALHRGLEKVKAANGRDPLCRKTRALTNNMIRAIETRAAFEAGECRGDRYNYRQRIWTTFFAGALMEGSIQWRAVLEREAWNRKKGRNQ